MEYLQIKRRNYIVVHMQSKYERIKLYLEVIAAKRKQPPNQGLDDLEVRVKNCNYIEQKLDISSDTNF